MGTRQHHTPVTAGLHLVTKHAQIGNWRDCLAQNARLDGKACWNYFDKLLDVLKQPTQETAQWSSDKRAQTAMLRGKKQRGRQKARNIVLFLVDVLVPTLERHYGPRRAHVTPPTGLTHSPCDRSQGSPAVDILEWEKMPVQEEQRTHVDAETNGQAPGPTDKQSSPAIPPSACAPATLSLRSSSPQTPPAPPSTPALDARLERACHVRHVLHGSVRLPALQLLEFEDRLRSRTYLVGPAVHRGFLSVADLLAFAVYRAYARDLLQDGLLAELPETLKWLANMQQLPAVAAMFRPLDLPSAPVEEEQERVACASYSLKPTWYGRNADTFDTTFGNSREAKNRRRRALPSLYTKCLPAVMERMPLPALFPSRAVDPKLAAEADERLKGMWTAPQGKHLDPAAGDLSPARALRKRQQIESMCRAVALVAQPGDTIVEFGAGGGHFGLCVAYCMPQCNVVLLERKLFSIVRAQRRVEALGLPNIECCVGDMADFSEKEHFQVGIAMHFCGLLTDLALRACVRQGAAFAFCPCCYGKVAQNVVQVDAQEDGDAGGDKPRFRKIIAYPQSVKYTQDLSISELDFFTLAASADQEPVKGAHQMPPNDNDSETSEDFRRDENFGRNCMGIVDTDRLSYAQEHGYSIAMSSLVPLSCTPRNNIIVGWPSTTP